MLNDYLIADVLLHTNCNKLYKILQLSKNINIFIPTNFINFIKWEFKKMIMINKRRRIITDRLLENNIFIFDDCINDGPIHAPLFQNIVFSGRHYTCDIDLDNW